MVIQMGMFDTLRDYRIKCPRCGMRHYEIQTKDLYRRMKHYTIAYPDDMDDDDPATEFLYDNVAHAPEKMRYIDATFICKSPICTALGRMLGYLYIERMTMRSLAWEMRYRVREDGLVCGPAEFTSEYPWIYEEQNITYDDENRIKEEFLEKIARDESARKAWEEAKGNALGEPMLAILSWRPKHE